MLGSTSRVMKGGYVNPRELEKGPNGRNLCRWCNLEVPKGRLTFCSAWCVEEWRLRTDPGHVRDCVLQRDRGICALCRLDTVMEWTRIRRLRRASLWDADHIVPVSEGGGECDLSNLRTLCLKCHRQVTQALRQRLAERAVPSSPVSLCS